MMLAAGKAPQKPKLPPLPNEAIVFVVNKDGTQPAEASAIEAKLGAALKAQNVMLADVDALFPAPAAPTDGDALYKEGKEAFDNLDLETAKQKFDAALESYGKQPAGASAEHIAEVGIYLGAVAQQSGAKNAGKVVQGQLVNALVVKPDVVPDSKLFGPDLPKLFEKAKAEVAAKAKGTLSFDVLPAGSEVTFRGQALTSPLEPVAGLPTGYHFVSARRAGYVPGAAVVPLKGDAAAATIELVPVEALTEARTQAGSLVGAFGAVTLPKNARSVGEKLKARFLVLADASTGALQVWDVQEGARLKDVKVQDSAESIALAATKVKTFVEQPSAVAVTKGPDEPPVASSGDSVAGKWWFWAAIGGAVAAGAAVGVVAATSTPPPRPLNPVLGF